MITILRDRVRAAFPAAARRLVTVLAVLAAGQLPAAAAGEPAAAAGEPEWDPGRIEACDRECLVLVMDRYMNAIFRRDPAALPPRSIDVRMTENTGVLDVGEGVLWRFATEPTPFVIDLADPVSGQVARQARLKIGGRDALVAVRLKVDGGKIEEIEHLYDRDVDPAALELLTQQPGSVLYYLTVAKLFAAADQTSEGIAFFERLAGVERVPQAHVARAYLLYWKRDYAQAINDLQGLPTSIAADPDAALLLAWAYLGAGNYVAAKATAYGVISGDVVTQRGVYEVAGQAAMGMGDAEGALDHFCLALSAGSRSAVAADGIRELCRMRMVPYSSIRRQLTQVYRYSDDPDPILQLARGLSLLPGYERLERWVRDRASTAG